MASLWIVSDELWAVIRPLLPVRRASSAGDGHYRRPGDRRATRRHVRPVPLPPVTISCSHEHEGLLAGTASITARTLYSIVTGIATSLERIGVQSW